MKKPFFAFFLMILLLLSACQNSSKKPNPEPPNLSVSLSPQGPVLTNSPLNFSVTVTGGTADKVELLLNDAVLVSFDSSYSYLWNNSTSSDASYSFKAVASAGSKTFTSNEVIVTLDKTAPSILSRSPQQGASGVLPAALATAVFSESILASSLSPASLSVSSKKGAALTASPSLSSDGKTLTVSLEGVTAPDTISIKLEGLSDEAGNSLSEVWFWSLPAPAKTLESFASLGSLTELLGAARDLGEKPLDIAANSAGTVLAFISDARVQVQSWSGTSWTSLLGLAVDTRPDSLPSVALLADAKPVVAWRNGTDNPDTPDIEPSGIRVQRWNGASWDDLGTVNSSLEASAPSLAIAKDDSIYVAYHQSDGTNPDVVVARYDVTSSSWQSLGSILDTSPEAIAINPALAIDSEGVPTVAWWEAESSSTAKAYVKQFKEGSWQALGTALNINPAAKADMLSVALGPDNLPVVAWHERDFAETDPLLLDRIYAKKWDGSQWQRLGDFIDRAEADGAQYPRLAVDANNTISIVWFESLKTSSFENNSILLAQWREAKWLETGQLDSEGPPIEQAYYPVIAFAGAEEAVTVAWIQDNLVDRVRLKVVQAE